MTDTNQWPSSGLLLIDKPEKLTSHDVVDVVRRLTGVKRVGHAGTLDPMATGLLIVLVGREFTKLQSQYLKADKEYTGEAQLGMTTDTYDRTGVTLTTTLWEKITQLQETDLKKAALTFTGTLTQTAPAYSAIKIQGQKLYSQARLGTIDLTTLPQRDVTIHEFEITNFSKDDSAQTCKFTFKVSCSSGTYIRSLIHDLGQSLHLGATLTQLRRTKIGEQNLKKALSLPPEYITRYLNR